MREPTFNLFLYVKMPSVTELGAVVHDLDGSDHEKISALQLLVDSDYQIARRYKPSRPLSWQDYESLMRLGRELEVFEEIFRDNNAPSQPLVAITPIVDGKPQFHAVMPLGPLRRDDLRGTPLEEPGMMVDYLERYISDGQFDIPRLINDDYFLAIKELFNAGHFVSCAKLLMSFIDTIAFIDAGDIRDGFITWLGNYADLIPLGITAKELWEFRNGLLHMTNLNSRAVASGKTAPLILYVGNPTRPLPASPSGAKYISLMGLIEATALALSKWIETYSHSSEKRVEFVTRYDLTISDSRLAYISMEPSAGATDTTQ